MGMRSILVIHLFLVLPLDGQSSDNYPDNFLVFVDSYNIGIYRMEVSNYSYSYANISLQTISNPVAIDYDPINGVIIWTDVGLNRIFSASVTGNNQTTIRSFSRLSVTDGIAVDAMSRLLFYTDTGNDIIAALSFDGSIQKTLINSSLYEPRAIVADPITGTIYWTDWGNISKIEKANYDGTNRQELIKTGLMWPNGLAADIQAGVLFWCDAGTEKIERANVDGSQRQVIYQAQQSAHFFGITLYQSYLYYTDWDQRHDHAVSVFYTIVLCSELYSFYTFYIHVILATILDLNDYIYTYEMKGSYMPYFSDNRFTNPTQWSGN